MKLITDMFDFKTLIRIFYFSFDIILNILLQ